MLSEHQWRQQQQHHRARLAPFIAAHQARRGRGEKHPVWDFLFEYYGFRASLLARWSPGAGVELGGDVMDFAAWKEWTPTPNGGQIDASRFARHRLAGVRETLEILEHTARRAPNFACFGLHEWAMLYRPDAPRHDVALRVSPDEIADLVDSQVVRCSHFDAFRFFTPSAAPLNVLAPAHDTRAAHEQPGCLHANMDIYKHATKFYPFIASPLLADAFELARFAREIDMRATPYDLRAWNFEPIRVERAEGRRHYVALQREIWERAAPVRARLIAAIRALLDAV